MKRAEDIPIEPLPDATWNRIERAVFAELDAGAKPEREAQRRGPLPRWAVATLAGAVVLQLAAAAAFLLARTDASRQPALSSTRFTTERESSETVLGDVSIRLEPASALVVIENVSRSSLVVLEHGAARFSVPHRGERPAFVVQAGDARVEVVGTRFRVERVGGSARVETYAGTVRVVAHGQSLLLARGKRWSGNPQLASAPEDAARALPAKSNVEGVGDAASRVQENPVAAGDDQRLRFEQAAAREASEPAAALRIYRALAQEPGRWGENALYAMARLEVELGHRTSARPLLQRYLVRYPKGANASDARLLLDRLTRHKERFLP